MNRRGSQCACVVGDMPDVAKGHAPFNERGL